MNRFRIILCVFCFCVSLNVSFSQLLKVDTAYTPEKLVDSILVGSGMRVGNIKLSGMKSSICYFKIDSNLLGMKSGILMSTGSVFDAASENTNPGTSGFAWDYAAEKKFKYDRDILRYCKSRSFDMIILEFDFVPFHNLVSFNYSFASEEYKEYVGSKYNDVFGFIVSGSGLRKQNIALLPDGKTPVTINNVNHKKNADLFISNDYFLNYGKLKNTVYKPKNPLPKRIYNYLISKKNEEGFYTINREKKKLNQSIVKTFEYDGFTKTMKATCYVKPWMIYHMKIAVADVGDAIFDSGVFLEEDSFVSTRDSTQRKFKDYPDLYSTMNWDSIFGIRKAEIEMKSFGVAYNEIDEQFEITNINFDSDKSVIPDTSLTQLELLAEYLVKNPDFKCQLFGYTDNVGSLRYNQNLSERRAIVVMNFLVRNNIDRSRMSYVGNNFENPIADNSDERGRAINRRVEIVLVND